MAEKKNYALVIAGEVQNVWRDVEGAAAEISPLNAARMIECAAEVEPGWRVDELNGSIAPRVAIVPTVREMRRREYFAVLRKEDGDEEITVLGDVVDVALAQIETLRQVIGAPATPEWRALVEKVTAVKLKLPKSGG